MGEHESFTTDAVILKMVDRGESDRLVTLLSADRGLIPVLCRGVRTLKSRRFAAIQLFSYAEMTLREHQGMLSLSEATLKENFFELRERLPAFAAASYFADLLLTVCVEGEGDSDILRLFLNALYLLAKRPAYPVGQVKTAFEIRLAADMGIQPDLLHCADCGKAAKEGFLDLSAGLLLCDDCAFANQKADPKAPEGASPAAFAGDGEAPHVLVPLGQEAVRLWQYVTAAPAQKLFSFAAPPSVWAEAGRASEKYLTYALGKIPGTLTFYYDMI